MAGQGSEQPESVPDQTDEISALKQTFPGRVRVINDVGEFTHVVTVQPVTDIDVHVKLQLSKTYPTAAPVIIIRSVALTTEQSSTLKIHLQNEADGLVGQMMMSSIMTSCMNWLRENNIEVSDRNISQTKTKGKSNQQNKHAGRKSKVSTEKEEKNSKKPPMKTAADVIKRIQWDDGVDKDDFIVGYMDRLVGLVERSFTAFTWEDLASVDHYSLAIPQHRIQYFKYKTEKVWDKNERLDNVFGSTGSKITIIEAIEKYNNNHPVENNDIPVNQRAVDEVIDGNDDLPDNDADFGDDDSDLGNENHGDDDDGIDVIMPTGRTGHEGNIGTANQADSEFTTCASNDYKSGNKGFRPNFFVAFRVSENAVVKRLVEVQDKIQSIYPQYHDEHRVPANGFHVTLAVMQMTSPEDERACVDAMERIKPEISSVAWDAGKLALRGIDFFSPKVIFAKTEQSPALLEITEAIRRSLRKSGIQIEDRQFKAHVTLFKLPKSAQFEIPSNNLHLGALSVFEFGSQLIDNIQVCRMGTVQVQEHEFCYSNIWRETLVDASTCFE